MAPRTLAPERPAPAPSPSAHPRMRARRAEVARSAGRRRLRRVKVLLAVVCAIVWSLVLVRSPLLDVDRVQVVGAHHTAPADVRAAAATPRGTPMAEVDLDRARRQVAALPWVAEVQVSRLWPGTVRLVVTERTPVATVAHPDGWATLDAEGRVLAVTGEAPDLPVLDGTRAVAPGHRLDRDDRAALEVVGALAEPLVDSVVGVATTAEGIELALDDGFRALFGDGSEVRAKAAATVAVGQHATVEGDACRIDVRVPSAPVLTSGRGCA